MITIDIVWVAGSGLSLLALGFLGCFCGGSQQQQQQQILNVPDEGEPQRICPDCGMENPREARHCGDCGSKFGTGSDSDE